MDQLESARKRVEQVVPSVFECLAPGARSARSHLCVTGEGRHEHGGGRLRCRAAKREGTDFQASRQVHVGAEDAALAAVMLVAGSTGHVHGRDNVQGKRMADNGNGSGAVARGEG